MPLDLTHLTKPPFNLSREDIAWVQSTFDNLDEAGRIGQVFNLRIKGDDPAENALLQKLQPGAITTFFDASCTAEAARARISGFQTRSHLPLLVSSDLEGSRMSLPFGTQVPNPIALAAIDDIAVTKEITRIMAHEARAVGINWSFTPVLDINAAPRSSIVATRSFGSNPERIARHAMAQIRVLQQEGLAATAKHWPGEGHDPRDQHLVTTINPLSMDEWDESHGRLYRMAIGEDVLAMMSAHIALPAYAATQGLEGADLYCPASLSAAITQGLLREGLGFNGLIVSDASEMAGLTGVMDATSSKPEILRAGSDMILFSNHPEQHVAAVLNAVRSGAVNAERLADAVTRVLALKAKLGLHRSDALPNMPARQDARIAPLLRRAPVLEKDIAGLLPLSPETTKRVLVVSPGIIEPLWNSVIPIAFPKLLEQEGFQVTVQTDAAAITPDDHDLVIYAFSEETLLTRGRIFLDWAKIGGGMRGAMQRIWHDIPTLMISFGYPYYLYDAPRVPCYVNAWATMDGMQEAVIDLLLGRTPWNNDSPIDVFADAPDARY